MQHSLRENWRFNQSVPREARSPYSDQTSPMFHYPVMLMVHNRSLTKHNNASAALHLLLTKEWACVNGSNAVAFSITSVIHLCHAVGREGFLRFLRPNFPLLSLAAYD